MRVFHRLRQSTFLRGVLAIAGGTALAQVASVLFLPLLTRLYSPEALGLWGLFVSFLGVASVAATLRYEVAIVAAGSEEEALALTRSTLVLAIVTGFLGGVALEVMRRADLLGYGALPSWVAPLGFAALTGTAWGMTLRYYAVRRGAFGLVGRFTVAQGVIRPVSQILLSSAGVGGLLLGEAVGRFLGLTALGRVLPRTPGCWWHLDVLLRFRSFPLLQLPSSFLNMMALMAPVPVFVALYGPAVGGALALAQRAVGLPVSLVGGAVADVFYGRVAELARTDPQRVRPFLVQTSVRLLLLALPFGLALGIAAPFLATWVFGEPWALTGKMMSIMAPWMVAQLAVSPVSRVVFLSRLPWVKLVYDGLSVLAIWALFIVHFSPEEALKLLAWLYVALYTLYWIILLWLAGYEGLSGVSVAGVKHE
ncbi:lipopolysaccharide biosynthesis protein [Fervidobacterium sp.]